MPKVSQSAILWVLEWQLCEIQVTLIGTSPWLPQLQRQLSATRRSQLSRIRSFLKMETTRQYFDKRGKRRCVPTSSCLCISSVGLNKLPMTLSCKVGGRDLKGTQVYPGFLGLKAWSPDLALNALVYIDTWNTYSFLSCLHRRYQIPRETQKSILVVSELPATILHVLAVQSSHQLVRSDLLSTLMLKITQHLIRQVRWQWNSKMKKHLMMIVASKIWFASTFLGTLIYIVGKS